jgi:hypothetical protein
MDNPDTGNIGHKTENEHKQSKKNTTQKAKKMSNMVRIKNRGKLRCSWMTSVSYNNVTHRQLR